MYYEIQLFSPLLSHLQHQHMLLLRIKGFPSVIIQLRTFPIATSAFWWFLTYTLCHNFHKYLTPSCQHCHHATVKISNNHLLYGIPDTHTHAYLRFVLCISTLFHHNSWMPWRCPLCSRAWNFSMCNQVQLHAPAQLQRSSSSNIRSNSNNIALKCLQTFASAAETLRQQATTLHTSPVCSALICCHTVAEAEPAVAAANSQRQGISYLQPHTRLRFFGACVLAGASSAKLAVFRNQCKTCVFGFASMTFFFAIQLPCEFLLSSCCCCLFVFVFCENCKLALLKWFMLIVVYVGGYLGIRKITGSKRQPDQNCSEKFVPLKTRITFFSFDKDEQNKMFSDNHTG